MKNLDSQTAMSGSMSALSTFACCGARIAASGGDRAHPAIGHYGPACSQRESPEGAGVLGEHRWLGDHQSPADPPSPAGLFLFRDQTGRLRFLENGVLRGAP
jgi:hypothetical protein